MKERAGHVANGGGNEGKIEGGIAPVRGQTEEGKGNKLGIYLNHSIKRNELSGGNRTRGGGRNEEAF